MNATYTVMNKVEALVSAAGAIAASSLAIGAVVLSFHVASVNGAADTDLAVNTPVVIKKA